MGFYDDDGVYHKDAYDDDHLDLKDIGKFCENRLYGTPDTSDCDLTEEERRAITERAVEVVPDDPPEQALSMSHLIGWLTGALIGLLPMHLTGIKWLWLPFAQIGSSIGRLYHRRIVEEVYLSPKETVQFLVKQREIWIGFLLLLLLLY